MNQLTFALDLKVEEGFLAVQRLLLDVSPTLRPAGSILPQAGVEPEKGLFKDSF